MASPGGKRLVAHVVAREGAGDLEPELKAHLGSQLPDHMVPSRVVVLDALPLLGNGKVNRLALPVPEWSVAATAQAEPEGEAERTLAGIWAEVLGLASVGATDNFFELGGDSILSLQVVGRARRAGLVLTPRQLF
ncbi:phosphopantetheine-binding protein, partial [Inquilinus sp. 2KB_12]